MSSNKGFTPIEIIVVLAAITVMGIMVGTYVVKDVFQFGGPRVAIITASTSTQPISVTIGTTTSETDFGTATLAIYGSSTSIQTPENSEQALIVLDAATTSVLQVDTLNNRTTLSNLTITGTCTGCPGGADITNPVFESVGDSSGVSFIRPTTTPPVGFIISAATSTMEVLTVQDGLYASSTLVVDGDARFDGQILIQDGTANNPSIIFTSDDDGTGTGFFRIGADNIGVSLGGTQQFQWFSTAFRSTNSNGPQMTNGAVTATAPSLIPRRSDTDTGIGSNGADELSLTVGATEMLRLDQDLLISFFPIGLVGIGTTTPGTLLAVQGNAHIAEYLVVGGALHATSTLTVTELTTLNGGLTIEDGDTFTFSGDAFTDFTGDGTISIVSGALRVVDVICTDCLNATEIEDIYLLDDGDIGTGVFDFGGTTSFEITNAAAPSFSAIGQIGLDTTDNQFLIATSTSDDPAVIQTKTRIWGVTVASTSAAFIANGLLAIPVDLDGYTMTEIRCKVDGGTSKVIAVEDASANSTEDITCATTVTSDDGSITNAAVTGAEEMFIDFGAVSGVVDSVSISVFGTWTRE